MLRIDQLRLHPGQQETLLRTRCAKLLLSLIHISSSRVDHTLLAQGATWNEIKAICDDGIKYGCASVCIPASYVKQAAEYVDGKIAVCTVIGFPNGYDTTAAKCFEAADAVKNGASEIDMVINVGWVKDKLYGKVLEEIKEVKAACAGRLLKVIIETCLLTEEEKVEMCRVVSESGADYIKTVSYTHLDVYKRQTEA